MLVFKTLPKCHHGVPVHSDTGPTNTNECRQDTDWLDVTSGERKMADKQWVEEKWLKSLTIAVSIQFLKEHLIPRDVLMLFCCGIHSQSFLPDIRKHTHTYKHARILPLTRGRMRTHYIRVVRKHPIETEVRPATVALVSPPRLISARATVMKKHRDWPAAPAVCPDYPPCTCAHHHPMWCSHSSLVQSQLDCQPHLLLYCLTSCCRWLVSQVFTFSISSSSLQQTEKPCLGELLVDNNVKMCEKTISF